MGPTRILSWLALALAGCGGAPCPEPPATAVEPPVSETPRAATADDAPTETLPPLAIELEPVVEDPPSVRVTVTAEPGARDWSLAEGAGAVRDLRVSAGGEPLVVEPERTGDALRLHLPEVASRVAVRYRTTAPSDGALLDPNQMLLHGDALLLIPDATTPVKTRVRIAAKRFGDHARAASCLGIGSERELELTSAALRRCSFVAGPVGHGRFDAPEGLDEAAWMGYTAFDPRTSAAEVASFRSAARQYFRSKAIRPFTLLVVADSRAPGAFAVRRRTASVTARVGIGQEWDGPLRLAVTQRVLREWIGGEVRLRAPDGQPAIWFSEGVARAAARQLLWRFGLLEPEDLRDEIEALSSVLLTSPGRNDPNSPHRGTYSVARGALYATLVDARIRTATGGKKSLDDVLRQLFERAGGGSGELPESAWVDAVAGQLGEAAAASLHADLRSDRALALPPRALGKCFTRVPETYPRFELGYEVARRGETRVVTVRRGSAAARAGLQSGDELIEQRYADQNVAVPVVLRIARGGETKRIEYEPRGAGERGFGWRVKPKATASECRR